MLRRYARISEKSETSVRICACRTKETRNRATAARPPLSALALPAILALT
jgi:hypothetical protein